MSPRPDWGWCTRPPLDLETWGNNWFRPDAPETCTFPRGRMTRLRVSRHFHLVGSISSRRRPDDSSRRAEHSRYINDFECTLYAMRSSRGVSLAKKKKKKNVSDLPGRLESSTLSISLFRSLSFDSWMICEFDIKNENVMNNTPL